MRRRVGVVSCAVCAMAFASAGTAHAQASFTRIRREAPAARVVGAPVNIAIPVAHVIDLDAARSPLLRLANLRTVTFAPDVSATIALGRRSVGLRFTIRL